MTVPATSGLPLGTTIGLLPSVRSFADGRLLFGGNPARLLRLRPAAARILGTTRTFTISESATAALADTLLRLGFAAVAAGEPAADLTRLTVVVPLHGGPEGLRRLLAHLTEVSVVIVDDASPDPESITAVAHEFGATLLRLEDNSGPAAARNRGLRHVTTPFTAFCDADITVDDDDLRRLLAHFADARVAAVAPRVAGLHQPDPNWITRYEDARSSLDLGPVSAVVQPLSRVGWVPSACLLARTEALGSGFDESLRVGEDVDLVWRLCRDGWLVRYDAGSTVHHEHRRTLRAWLSRKYRYGTSAAPLAVRHGDKVAPAVLSPALAALTAAVIAQRRTTLPVAAGALLIHTLRLRKQLHATGLPSRYILDLTRRSTIDAFLQIMALLLRHWWPATVVAATISRRMRRAAFAAVVLDTFVEYRSGRTTAGLGGFLIARRLDDAAYGLGVWRGALRARSLQCLTPRLVLATSRRDRP